jgi:hypothetical protein
LKQREVIEVSLNRDCGVEPAMTVRAIVGRGRFFSTAQDSVFFYVIAEDSVELVLYRT